MAANTDFRSPQVFEYDRAKAVLYAHNWALGRNPNYLDFENFGGDCTNFASQVILAGCGTMNYTPVYGWYYNSSYDRTASWTGVNYLHSFLVNNKDTGPFAVQADIKDAEPGDIAQVSFTGDGVYQHSPVIISTGRPVNVNNILVAAHTDNRDYYPITEYGGESIRIIHILGYRI